jgi:hypothetical protein
MDAFERKLFLESLKRDLLADLTQFRGCYRETFESDGQLYWRWYRVQFGGY